MAGAITGGSGASADIIGGPSAPGNNDWYLVQDLNGAIGLVRGAPTANVINAYYVGAASDFNQLMNNFATEFSAAQTWLFSNVPVTTKQVSTFITQIDHGAGLGNPNWLYVSPSGSASSNASTSLGSEAVPTNIIPSPIPASVGNSNIGQEFSFLNLVGNLGFWKGIGLVIGGAAILIFAALELKGI